MIHSILRALTALPHRGAATPEGKEAARILQDYLADLGADVHTEPFRTPKTYAPVLYWLIGGLVVSLALVPVTGVAIGLASYFVVLAWRYFNWQYSFIIKFPIQHTAENIIGHIPALRISGKRRRVILMAHYDTAPVSFLYKSTRQTGFQKSLILLLALMGVAVVLSLAELAKVGLPYLTYVRYVLMLYFMGQMIVRTAGYWRNGYTNGASDNATGVAAALATADRLQQLRIPDLDIDVVLTSAKEVGMVGAYCYVEAHKREWKATQTVAINFDTLGAGKLTVIEQTGTLDGIHYKNELTRLARQLVQTDVFRERTQVGEWHTTDFDSVWFVRNRIPVLALCAQDNEGHMPRIHQPDDTLDHVDTHPLETAVDLAEAVIRQWAHEQS